MSPAQQQQRLISHLNVTLLHMHILEAYKQQDTDCQKQGIVECTFGLISCKQQQQRHMQLERSQLGALKRRPSPETATGQTENRRRLAQCSTASEWDSGAVLASAAQPNTLSQGASPKTCQTKNVKNT